MAARWTLCIGCCACAVGLMSPGAKQSVSSLSLDHGAVGASGRTAAGAKSLFVTMTFPTDDLPLEVMLPHQLHMVTKQSADSLDVVILDNRPPGAGGSPQDPFLEAVRAQQLPWLTVAPVDYGLRDDPAFLARFFVFPKAKKARNLTVSDVAPSRHERTNLLGMLHALAACLDAEPSVEVCLYLDPDVFLHRRLGGQGLLDLAPALFEAEPGYVVLEPPMLCDAPIAIGAGDGPGACVGKARAELSQRHLVFHRARLAAALPLAATREGATSGKFRGRFEKTLSGCMQEVHGAGAMRCGAETFATHPSIEPEAGPEASDASHALTAREHFAALAASAEGAGERHVKGFPDMEAKGAQVLISRLQAGSFEVERSADEKEGRGQYTDHCLAMRPSRDRVERGLAF